ncbi:MAG: electron transport complex subunit RsxD [Pseudomonadales bacterium]|nr:electron transport complex subunit RsxD [Pseudomonadales bacterium]
MKLEKVTSPHLHGRSDTGHVMRLVILATLPGLVALTWFFGWGVFINLLWAWIVALGFETLVVKIRKRPLGYYINDYSALVTATLLGLALPPLAPWWLTVVGVGFAIVIAKHLYGGLGSNPFNPAAVGYVVLLISFPAEMSSWVPARGIEAAVTPGFIDSLSSIFPVFGNLLGQPNVDIITQATPLDLFKQKQGLTTAEIWQPGSAFGHFAGVGWEWVNLGFLVGGIFLLQRRIIYWHIPVSMLGTLLLMSLIFWGGSGSESNGSPMFHLFSGATMLCAFFIATDPVTAATSTRGRLMYGAGIGLIIYVIRVWGNYPDAVAFAVLLMNFCAPLIDQYVQPRTYGHSQGQNKGHKQNKSKNSTSDQSDDS